MSALGQKRTLKRLQPTSALPPKADIRTWPSSLPPPCEGEWPTNGLLVFGGQWVAVTESSRAYQLPLPRSRIWLLIVFPSCCRFQKQTIV